MRPDRRRLLSPPLGLGLVAALLSFACGGGGGGGTPTTPTPPPQEASAVFTPAGSRAANSVSLQQSAASTPTSLVLEVVATSVAEIYGVAFELTLPSVVEFRSATEGAFLGADGAGTSLQAATRGNVLVIGMTRLGNVEGVSGGGVLLQLDLRPAVAGSGALTFSRTRALLPDGDDAVGITWASGTVQVTG